LYFVTGIDVLEVAPFLNAVIYGAIIWTYLVLIEDNDGLSRSLIFVGGFAILFSRALFPAATSMMTELPFILLSLLFFVAAQRYSRDGKVLHLFLLSLTCALAFLTRYAGITLLACGLIAVIYNVSKKSSRYHVLAFAVIGGLIPAGWILRNYLVGNSLTGNRFLASTGIFENTYYASKAVLEWVIPSQLAEMLPQNINIILSISLMLIVFVCSIHLGIRRWRDESISMVSVFNVTYVVFIITAASITAFQRIDSRLMAPIFVPMVIVLITEIDWLVNELRSSFSKGIVFLLCVWLLFPLVSTVNVMTSVQNGAGYMEARWRQSSTVTAVSNDADYWDAEIYSNHPDVLYLFAGMNNAKKVPNTKHGFTGPEVQNHQHPLLNSELGAGTERVYIVWFTDSFRDYLMSPEEMGKHVNLRVEEKHEDGTIYRAE
jgi:hypothetical protein